MKLRIINVRTEGIGDSSKISAVAIGRKLHPVCETIFQVVHEVISAARVTFSDEPAGNEFGIKVERHPG